YNGGYTMSLGAYVIYFALLMIIPLWAQSRVKHTYQKYSKIASSSGLRGKEVAEQILQDNGIYDVEVQPVKGTLTDHYDPKKNVVRLSANNYYGRSKAAVAVSAHEVGHAIQDAEEYAFLRFRSNLVPLASFGSSSAIWIIIAGMLFQMSGLLLVGIVFMAFAVLFQLVTLPVEFNASNRAMDQLVMTGIIPNDEEKETKKVLDAAALTYVAAALVAVAELMRFVLIFLGSRD